MSRPRKIPDERIFMAVEALLETGGGKSVTFAAVAAATGLAASTLVQRYGSLSGMVRAARMAAWDVLDARTAAAISATAEKGPQALLKGIVGPDPANLAADLRDPALAGRANAWRDMLLSALAQKLGGGERSKESAALLIAAWQGQALWQRDGDSGFRLKDAVKRLT